MHSTESKKISSTTIASQSTMFYADSVEWCHLETFQDLLICGTYQMEDDSQNSVDYHPQVRKGNVVLYQIIPISDTTPRKYLLESKTSLNTSGVLDMKWSPQYINEKCTAGVAFSDGSLKLLQVSRDDKECLHIDKFCDVNIATEDKTLALSLDWSSWKHNASPESIVVSDSSGHLNHISLSNDGLHLKKKWKAHDFEAWIAAFDYDETNIVFSGGDDCYFKSWDLRSNLSSPLFINKSHTMGVTSAVKSKHHEHLLATGSYDEYVRFWDRRKMKAPIFDIHIGGGVWRIKWHPISPNHVSIAAMQNGFHILQLQSNSSADIISSYNHHTSLAYGVDWRWSKDMEERTSPSSGQLSEVECSAAQHMETIVASCSFYDKSLHLWTVKFPYFA